MVPNPRGCVFTFKMEQRDRPWWKTNVRIVYHHWENQEGAWWRALGSGNFTVWDFLSTMAFCEANGNAEFMEDRVMTEAGVRWYYAHCPGINDCVPYSCTSPEPVLNWWAAYSQSSAGRYQQVIVQNDALTLPAGNLYAFRNFGPSFRNPPTAWTAGWAYDRPYGWANLGYDGIFSPNAQLMFLDHPDALFVIYGNDYPFVIPSGCAYYNWNTLNNRLPCPSVRP